MAAHVGALPIQPGAVDADAPTGGAVSTTGDLTRLAIAVVIGTARSGGSGSTPGTDRSDTRIGSSWPTSTWQTGQTGTHHAGQTGGDASWLGLDRHARRAVIVLTDVANDAGALGGQLLADHTKGTS